MKDNIKISVKKILDNYLEATKCRKTPERYAILDAIYSIKGHFSLEQLDTKLQESNFRVSRATLYNTIKLFIELRLIIKHHLLDGTKYEACYDRKDHCHQICTVCGNVTELNASKIIDAIDNTKLKRFRKDVFSLYIYGVCSACQAKITRRIKTNDSKENKKIKNIKNEHRQS